MRLKTCQSGVTQHDFLCVAPVLKLYRMLASLRYPLQAQSGRRHCPGRGALFRSL